jgi:hypothetical protein
MVLMAFTRNSLKILAREWIVALFNNILTSGKIPKQFKRAKVITINPDPSHFRPISLLSIVSKILERMILQKVLCKSQKPSN